MSTIVYTDGSIIENPGGAGGWAAVYVSGDRHRIISGSEYDTTNNRQEMQAAIEGIRAFSRRNIQTTLVSDSEYVIHGFTKGRVQKNAANNFTKKGKRIPNADLWEALNELDIYLQVKWVHHGGEHRVSSRLEGAEHYMALAHEFALSEARIAHYARLVGMEGIDIPRSAQERTALIELLKHLPTPPDPPSYTKDTHFAVYQRIGSPGNLLFRGPLFTPMHPSRYEDERGTRDGGRWACHKAARTMNATDETKEAGRYRDWRIPRYVVMRSDIQPSEIKKQTGAAYYQITQEQFDRFQKEAGKDDGILRSIPGGRAGGRINGSLQVG